MDNSLTVSQLWSKFSDKEINYFEKIPASTVNDIFLIALKDSSKKVLSVYDSNQTKKEKLETRAYVEHQLNEEKIPVPSPIQGFDGKFVQSIDNSPLIATAADYIQSKPERLPTDSLSIKVIQSMAENLALLHSALKKIDSKDNIDTLLPLEKIKLMINEESVNKVKEFFNTNLPYANHGYPEMYLKNADELKSLAQKNENLINNNFQLTHGDYSIPNLEISNEKVVSIFDLDELKNTSIWYDIATTIIFLDHLGHLATEELIIIFLKSYFQDSKVGNNDLICLKFYLQYVCFYRIFRWFTFKRFITSPNRSRHFTYFQKKLEEYKSIDIDKIYQFL